MASSLTLVARKIFGSKNERELKRMRPIVEEINQLEPAVAQRTDEELRAKIAELKARISAIEASCGSPRLSVPSSSMNMGVMRYWNSPSLSACHGKCTQRNFWIGALLLEIIGSVGFLR